MDRIACALPTFNRPDMLIDVLNTYCKNVTIPTDIVIYDNSYEEHMISTEEILERVDLTNIGHQITYLRSPEPAVGAGAARYGAIQHILSSPEFDNHRWVINLDDDAFVGKGGIENIVRTLDQGSPKIAYAGSIANYVMWDRDFTPLSVRFKTNLGILYGVSLSFMRMHGQFDPGLRLREDVDLGLNCWVNGYYVVAVHAPVVHKRSGDKADFVAGSDAWMLACYHIQDKYGKDKITVTKNGQIRRKKTLQYPKDFYYEYDKELNLHRIEVPHEDL